MDELLRNYDHVRSRVEELTLQMGDPKVLSDAREAKRVGRERSRLARILEAMDVYRQAADALQEAEEILAGDDAELQEIVRDELSATQERKESTEIELKRLLTPRDPNDEKDVIVEIRAGTGGEEAALFVRDIFRMYVRYAENRGFRLEELSSNATGIGGLKEVIFSLMGEDAFANFKFEAGCTACSACPRPRRAVGSTPPRSRWRSCPRPRRSTSRSRRRIS